jgi:MoaA/NifB/PqqE/SkfB family radical SAM enzyme
MTQTPLQQYSTTGFTVDSSANMLEELNLFLKNANKDTFAVDERIVIHVNNATDVLESIVSFLCLYDIPNHFVILVSDQNDFVNKVKLALSNASTDTSSIQVLHNNQLISIHNVNPINKSKRPGDPSGSFCILPWLSISIEPHGIFRACCQIKESVHNKDGRQLNINNDSIEDARNSHTMQELRKDFLAGKRPSSCSNCWKEEEAGNMSKRQGVYKIMSQKPQVWSEQILPLSFVDLKLGNLCNLKCRICESKYSSMWANEELSLMPSSERKQSDSYNYLKLGRWPEKENFWNELNKYADSMEYIEFTGGEPMMTKAHFDLLKHLIDKGLSSKIRLHYHTNGTIFPKEHDLWKQFKQVEIAFSIDDTGERFEYERTGADWNTVVQNLEQFKNLRTEYKNVSLIICSTVSAYNVLYLDQIAKWRDEQQFDVKHWNILHEKTALSITSLPDNAKQIVTQKLLSNNKSEFESIVNFMNNTDTSTQALINDIQLLDQRRNESLEKVFPELNQLMQR